MKPTMTIEDLKPGDAILCYTPITVFPLGILSWLIRLFLRIPYNHLKFVSEHNGKLFITESDQHGTHPELLETNLKNSKSTRFLVLRPTWFKDRARYSEIITNTWGRNYGWFLLVKYAWAIVTGQPFRSRKARLGQVLVCSHPGAYALGYMRWWHWTPRTWYTHPNFVHYDLNL